MRRIAESIAVLLTVLPLIASSAGPAKTDGAESLGSKLLQGLEPSAPDRDSTEPVTNPSPRSVESRAMVPTVPSPLAHVQQRMENASLLLHQPALASQSGSLKLADSAQRDVVTQLDKLIAELSKQCQCQGGNCSKPPEPSQSDKPKPGGRPSMAAGSGNAPARESSDRLDRDSAKHPEKGNINEFVKDLWGHLPEHSREQLLQSFSEEFLPKYEREIEQYYRRLSEEQGDRSENALPRN